jgi:hypothetical protein
MTENTGQPRAALDLNTLCLPHLQEGEEEALRAYKTATETLKAIRHASPSTGSCGAACSSTSWPRGLRRWSAASMRFSVAARSCRSR